MYATICEFKNYFSMSACLHTYAFPNNKKEFGFPFIYTSYWFLKLKRTPYEFTQPTLTLHNIKNKILEDSIFQFWTDKTMCNSYSKFEKNRRWPRKKSLWRLLIRAPDEMHTINFSRHYLGYILNKSYVRPLVRID